MLAGKGLLGARPKQGTFVRPEEARNLFDPDVLRRLIERRSSVVLLRRFSEPRIAVAVGLERMRSAEISDDDALEADVAFHVAVLRASNNPFFSQFRDAVATALSASIGDHAAVADAILARDGAAAHAAMETLIAKVLDLIVTSVEQGGGDAGRG